MPLTKVLLSAPAVRRQHFSNLPENNRVISVIIKQGHGTKFSGNTCRGANFSAEAMMQNILNNGII